MLACLFDLGSILCFGDLLGVREVLEVLCRVVARLGCESGCCLQRKLLAGVRRAAMLLGAKVEELVITSVRLWLGMRLLGMKTCRLSLPARR